MAQFRYGTNMSDAVYFFCLSVLSGFVHFEITGI